MREGMSWALEDLKGAKLKKAKQGIADVDAEIERLQILKTQIEAAIAKKQNETSPALTAAKKKYSRKASQSSGEIKAPAAISVQVADLKFGPQGVQVLEVQSGIGSAFEGYHELYGEQMMDHIWRYINSIKQSNDDTGLRVLYVGGDMEVMLGGRTCQNKR